MSERRAVLIVNTKSRRGREWMGQCHERLVELGLDIESHPFKTIEQLITETASAINRKVPLVIAGGGDGTFSAIARLFVGSESVMGVLPLGTGNQFARDLGIPTDPKAACEIVANGKIATVDLGIAAEDYFLNVATIGVTTEIAKSLTVEAKRRLGRFVYVMAMVRGLQKTKPFKVHLETDNGTMEFETLQLVIGNGRYHAGPFVLAPNASITEGKLSVYALKTTNKAAFLKLGLYLTTGKHVDLPEVHYEEATKGTVLTIPPMRVTIDGEVCARTPFHFGVAPDILRVMAPDSFERS